MHAGRNRGVRLRHRTQVVSVRTARTAEGNSAFEHELRPLVDAAVSRRLILFAGGGVSQNLGLPDFKALVGHIAEEMGLAPKRFGVADYAVVAEAYQVREKQLGKLR